MQPNRFGRVLGVSTRLAAEKLQKAAQASSARPPSAAPSAAAARPAQPSKPQVKAYVEGSRRLAQGAGRFGGALWRPFAHATAVLWLEISGVFFALFALFFIVHASQVYRTSGWHERHATAYAILALLFSWFAVSSFWRAGQKRKKA